VSTSTNKKVLVARFDKAALEGFVQLPEGLGPAGLDVLSPTSQLTKVPLKDIRAVCFIREFEEGETWRAHRTFQSRPKAPGLWVRVKFRDGEILEGVMPNNLLGDPGGISLTPPDPTFQNQRIFVPREAAATVEVLGVIGSPLRRPAKKKPVDPDADKQLQMFP
jgi:hypothetical protein